MGDHILISIDPATGVAYDRDGKPCGRWVPDESTPDQERSGANTFGGQGDSADARYEVSVMYRTMLSAGPPPPASLAHRVDVESAARKFWVETGEPIFFCSEAGIERCRATIRAALRAAGLTAEGKSNV